MEQNLISWKPVKKENVMYEEGHSAYMECGLPWKHIEFLEMGVGETNDGYVGLAIFENSPLWNIIKTTTGGIYIDGDCLIFKMHGVDYYFASPSFSDELIQKIKEKCGFSFAIMDEEHHIKDSILITDTNLCP